MSVAGGITKFIVGRNLASSGGRVTALIFIAIGYVAGAKLGIPEALQPTVDGLLNSLSDMIGNIMPGGDN